MLNGKDRLKTHTNHILEANHLERVDGIQFLMNRDASKTKSIDIDLVEDEYKKYELPVLTNNQYRLLLNMIAHFNGTLKHDLPFESIYTAIELQEKIENAKVGKCNVSDLPEGHPAVEVKIAPSIRIFAKK